MSNDKINTSNRFILEDESFEVEPNNDQKQNMTLPGFTTTKDLDLELESILKSIEPEVMAAIKKTKYFDKKE